ncbi:Acyl-CoA N-acyltransferase [Melia azedarach]|uniref:Acyl-CoA N-acyltransferase n=1 Tax=Melia azedarach TaxID=155640 RepID=A0ACC1Y322_MELAZ|nr:Acyl-CoA N-acyltransferase [Melia azedarach]
MAAVVSYCKPSPFLGRFRLPQKLGKLSHRQGIGSRVRTSRICALFWGTKKSVEQQVLDSSLGDFTLKGSEPEGDIENQVTPKKIYLSVISSISEVSSDDWDACALDATGLEKFNPFLTHGFLSSLEETGCAVKETGWTPCHIVAKDECENVLGVVPLYLKSHSYGEFVFDHAWADAYYSYGARYYPKFQCCVPFTPVTGPRILIRNTSIKDQVLDVIISSMKDLVAKSQVSSVHVTFSSEDEWQKFKDKGFMQRIGMQYHWKNRNYKNFDEFLMNMKQSKRKNIRQERKKIPAQNLTLKRLRGYEIKAKHWDSFYKFYRNTTDNKWGSPYLTRDFFHDMGSKMEDQVLLVVAEEGDELVAGALNLIGGDTLFGRLWGCHPRAYYPSLHFEACYYQAIEAAIELNLNTVEAGAQGEHKIQRGYMPVTTYSCHYLIDEDFKKPIENFLEREATQVRLVMKLLHESGPFKEGIQQK